MRQRKPEVFMSQGERLAILETTTNHIHEVLERLDKRFDSMEYKFEERFNKIDDRFNKIDDRFNKIDERFDKVDERFDKVDERFEKVDERFEKMDIKINDVELRLRNEMTVGFREINNRLWFLVFWVVTSLAGTLGVLAKSLHWF